MSLLCCGCIVLAHAISFKLIITVSIEACSDSNLWKVYLRCGGVLLIALFQESLHFPPVSLRLITGRCCQSDPSI